MNTTQKPKRHRQIGGQPVIRSTIARAAWERNGAGKHGGSTRQHHRRNRQSIKRDLRRGEW